VVLLLQLLLLQVAAVLLLVAAGKLLLVAACWLQVGGGSGWLGWCVLTWRCTKYKHTLTDTDTSGAEDRAIS